MKKVKFKKEKQGEAIIETTTQALSNLGWCFDQDDALSERDFIKRYPYTDLYFGNFGGKLYCGMINYRTQEERNNYTSIPTENPNSDYSDTLNDIITLLSNEEAKIYGDDHGLFKIKNVETRD